MCVQVCSACVEVETILLSLFHFSQFSGENYGEVRYVEMLCNKMHILATNFYTDWCGFNLR